MEEKKVGNISMTLFFRNLMPWKDEVLPQ